MSDQDKNFPGTAEKMWLYLATKGLCEDFQEWARANNPQTVSDVALLFSKIIRQRDEAADEALLEMEQRANK